MGSAVSTFIRTLVDEEIQWLVADAVADGGTLSAPATAATIPRTYPNCGLTEKEIAHRLTMAASVAGIAVELGSSKAADERLHA